MKKAFIPFLLIISILFPISTFSQSRPSARIIKKRIHESLKEKVKLPSMEKWLEANQSQNPNSTTLPQDSRLNFWKNDSSTEVQITQEGGAESEVHAAISPVDSNIIIVSAMKQDPTNILDPLTFPTYYTSDFGNSWSQSSFTGAHPGGIWLQAEVIL